MKIYSVVKHLSFCELIFIIKSFCLKMGDLFYTDCLENHIDGWIDPEEICIKGFINIKKKYAIKNERRWDREYNRYIWMGLHEGGDVFGLRRLFDMEEDITFAPESWN
ncbi:hypothetical protein PUN28_020646 [Cardiocondyla obscurior]|uniref:Uncharacterized protein n=1 Tax=Cardiocondyla obscurior TaxID=286306 RepID=A0AAW2E6V2_9HYME